MAAENQNDQLKELLNKHTQELRALDNCVKDREVRRFDESNGCKSCRGRGWVVTWDTMDSMSGCYHEHTACSAEGCTSETRQNSGLEPKNNKYDGFHNGSHWSPQYNSDELAIKSDLEEKIGKLRFEIESETRRFTPSEGKVVKVVSSGRGPKAKRIPTGIIGIVKKSWTNDWGVNKLLIIDSRGQKWWPKAEHVEVTDPEPDMGPWEKMESEERQVSGYPVIATVKRKARSGKATFVRTTTGVEMWVPMSQASELKEAKVGDTLSIMLPMWLATQKGLVVQPSQ